MTFKFNYYLFLLLSQCVFAQNIKDFYYLEPETKNLPVFIRGNLDQKTILLYVQGGDAENGIDFGRSDYAGWKNTLEKNVAIAYFDQRGLNRNFKKIDTAMINSVQVQKDIIKVAESLQQEYDAEIILFGHSNGGRWVLNTLANFPDDTEFIKAGIAFNTPITTDFSEKRYRHYRPLYLKNLAKSFIENNTNSEYWQEALDWMKATDSIATPEDSKRWNTYVDNAFEPTKRKIGLGMVLKTVFARPYNPISYMNQKDNKYIGDKLWYDEKFLWDEEKQIPLWDVLPNINKPVLLLTGRFDAIATPEEQQDAVVLIPDAKLEIIPGCAHESFLDQPEDFNQSVLSFISETQL
jgi:pimeloyl-ACP methyl ester carboxylesterase